MTEQTSRSKSVTFKLGIVLLILGTLLWLSVLVFPFLPLPVRVKVAGGAATAIIAETVSWTGAFCIGKEIVVKYKRHFNPKNWKKLKKVEKAEKVAE